VGWGVSEGRDLGPVGLAAALSRRRGLRGGGGVRECTDMRA
jgi:hypothetical protein